MQATHSVTYTKRARSETIIWASMSKRVYSPLKSVDTHTHSVTQWTVSTGHTHTRGRVKISGNTGGREGVTVADPTRMMPSHGEATVIVNLLCNIYIVRHISTYRHFHCAIRADKQLNRVNLTCQTPFMEAIIGIPQHLLI